MQLSHHLHGNKTCLHKQALLELLMIRCVHACLAIQPKLPIKLLIIIYIL
jgi:hypothetical protein